MSYRYVLMDHGRTLATRPLGRALRTDLVKKASGEEIVALDFSGIARTSHSFADEFVAHLVEESANGDIDFDVQISGTSRDVERVVRKALERRSVEFPVLA